MIEAYQPVGGMSRQDIHRPLDGMRNLTTVLHYDPNLIHNVSDRDKLFKQGTLDVEAEEQIWGALLL